MGYTPASDMLSEVTTEFELPECMCINPLHCPSMTSDDCACDNPPNTISCACYVYRRLWPPISIVEGIHDALVVKKVTYCFTLRISGGDLPDPPRL